MTAVAFRPPEFENYRIVRQLGEGGMGVVYLGHDLQSDIPVAIKVMSKRLHDPDLQRRFLRETEILLHLNHRNVVRCNETVRTLDGVPSIIMEYLDGVDFRAFDGRPYPELLPLMMQAAMGLKYLKSKHVLHRDLSSNNIMVILEHKKRLVKILDFGVAKVLRQQPKDGDVHTQTNQFLGKFAFASPESFYSTDVDWRSDVYSLGVIFHRLLLGQSPVRVEKAGSYLDWMNAHQIEHVPRMTVPAGLPDLPEPLKDIVRRMLARDPRERPASYDEIIDRIDAVQRVSSQQGMEPDAETLANLPLAKLERSGGSAAKPRSGSDGPYGSGGRDPDERTPVESPLGRSDGAGVRPSPNEPVPSGGPSGPPEPPCPTVLDEFAGADEGTGRYEGPFGTGGEAEPIPAPPPVLPKLAGSTPPPTVIDAPEPPPTPWKTPGGGRSPGGKSPGGGKPPGKTPGGKTPGGSPLVTYTPPLQVGPQPNPGTRPGIVPLPPPGHRGPSTALVVAAGAGIVLVFLFLMWLLWRLVSAPPASRPGDQAPSGSAQPPRSSAPLLV